MSDGDRADPPVAMGVEPLVVSPRLRYASEVVWRTALLVLAAAVIGLVLWKLKIVVLPIFVALLLCTALTGPVVALERRGWSSTLAAFVVFVSFFLVVAGVLILVIPPAVDGVSGLGEATTDVVGDLADWLVDGPLGLDRKDVERYTSDPAGQVISLLKNSSISLSSGAKMVGDTLVGVLLSLVLTFFFLKDGRRFQQWTLGRLNGRRREAVVRRAAERAWATFGGYLRGSATLGAIEGTIIGLTVFLVGGPLGLAIGVITFVSAFFPIVGAIVAGLLAVLVTLASSGVGPALIVLAVAVVVQQLDGDLLGPWIFGHAVNLHPVVILLVLTAGGSIGGIVGAFVAVPLTGAVVGVAEELWQARSLIDEIAPDDRSGLFIPGADDPGYESGAGSADEAG